MIAWIITIPASAVVAALFYWLVSGRVGQALLAVAVLASAGMSAVAWREFKRSADFAGRAATALATVGFVAVAIICAYASLS